MAFTLLAIILYFMSTFHSLSCVLFLSKFMYKTNLSVCQNVILYYMTLCCVGFELEKCTNNHFIFHYVT